MSDRLIRDNPVSDEQIQAWADEAERGYDLTKLAPPAPGPSPSGERPGSSHHGAVGRAAPRRDEATRFL